MGHSSPGAHFSHELPPANRPADFIDDLNEAVRQNPVPAVLIGAGLFWMFMGGAKNTMLGNASRSLLGGMGRGAQQAGSAASRGARQVGGAMAEGMSSLAESAKAASESSAAAVSSVAERVSEGLASGTRSLQEGGQMAAEDVAQGMHSLQQSGQAAGKSVQQTLGDLFEKQPLLVGALGAALGAAMAAALPASPAERRLMGEAAETVKEKAGEVWSETTERAEAAVSKGLEEARAQGLTPEAAGQAMREVTEKVVDVAERTKRRAVNRIKNVSPDASG
jgi:hypothetical protein